MLPKVYIDTSVIGGCLDDEFTVWSKLLFEEFRSGIKIAVVSDLTLQELEDAPPDVRKILSDLPADAIEYVFLSDEAVELADTYIARGVVTEKHLIDTQHIAIATIAKVDILVSWNFKQIVNLDRIRKFNAVNLTKGYHLLEIRSPQEVLYGQEN
ncbi:MAG: PIN domain protein [Nitrospirae bacterium]|nr:PIN domain protein [Nitrospirota bacterium]